MDLVLFTLSFPYGTKETFLESEIEYLSKGFDRIFIIPNEDENGILRNVPSNVTVKSNLFENPRPFSMVNSLPFLFKFLPVFLFCVFSSKHWMLYFVHVKSMLHHFYNDFKKHEELKSIIEKEDLNEALFYDYWLLNSTLSLISLKKTKRIKKILARAHRFDLYNESCPEGVVPFKEYKIKNLDYIFTISHHGEDYLKKEFLRFHNKISTSYLGVKGGIKQLPNSTQKTIVSCSSVLKFKQVDKIVEVLSNVSSECKWIHFGTGPLMSELKEKVKDLPNNIEFELKGFVSNPDVLQFYSQNYVDCFISLTSSEGLPVSFMEAQGYGIPIIAPAINGIPEIVNDKTGVLLPLDYSIKDVANILDQIFMNELEFNRDEIVSFFNKNFSSIQNYTLFTNTLQKLFYAI